MFYSNEQRKNEILKFVKLNPKTTKSKVIEHMTKRRMSSLVITQALLIELIDSGKIIVLRDKPNSRNHRLVLNSGNQFNRLTAEIANLEDISSKQTDVFIKDISNQDFFESKFNSSSFKQHVFNLIIFHQLDIFGRTTALVDEIAKNIESQDDRQALHHLLPNLLLISDRLNKVILPEVRSSTKISEYIKKRLELSKGD